MGKAISRNLKSKVEFLLENIPEQFSEDFYRNKQVLKDLKIPFSAVNRNWVAGLITRKIRAQKTEKKPRKKRPERSDEMADEMRPRRRVTA